MPECILIAKFAPFLMTFNATEAWYMHMRFKVLVAVNIKITFYRM
jgi:hypothetical protein